MSRGEKDPTPSERAAALAATVQGDAATALGADPPTPGQRDAVDVDYEPGRVLAGRYRIVAWHILVGFLGIFTAILWQMVGDPSSAIQFAIMTIVYFVFVFRLGLLATAVLGGCINLLGMFAPDPLLDWWWGQSALLPMGVIATFAIVGCVIATGPERRMLRTANRTSATIR
jgi:hypothetical protein